MATPGERNENLQIAIPKLHFGAVAAAISLHNHKLTSGSRKSRRALWNTSRVKCYLIEIIFLPPNTFPYERLDSEGLNRVEKFQTFLFTRNCFLSAI